MVHFPVNSSGALLLVLSEKIDAQYRHKCIDKSCIDSQKLLLFALKKIALINDLNS